MSADIDVDFDDINGDNAVPAVWKDPHLISGVFPCKQPFFRANQNFFLHNISITKNQADIMPSTTAKNPCDLEQKHGSAAILGNSRQRRVASQSSSTISSSSPTIPNITKNIKILILGNAKCGKSSLINRYCHGTFSEKYKTTIGADFIRKDIAYQCNQEAESVGVRLQVDTSPVYFM